MEIELMKRDQILKDLKENLKMAQDRMKKIYDLKHREKVYKEGT